MKQLRYILNASSTISIHDRRLSAGQTSRVLVKMMVHACFQLLSSMKEISLVSQIHARTGLGQTRSNRHCVWPWWAMCTLLEVIISSQPNPTLLTHPFSSTPIDPPPLGPCSGDDMDCGAFQINDGIRDNLNWILMDSFDVCISRC